MWSFYVWIYWVFVSCTFCKFIIYALNMYFWCKHIQKRRGNGKVKVKNVDNVQLENKGNQDVNLWHRNSALSVTQLVLAISVTTIIIPSLHSRSHHIMVFSKNFSLHFSSSWQHAVKYLLAHVIIWFDVIQCLCFFLIIIRCD